MNPDGHCRETCPHMYSEAGEGDYGRTCTMCADNRAWNDGYNDCSDYRAAESQQLGWCTLHGHVEYLLGSANSNCCVCTALAPPARTPSTATPARSSTAAPTVTFTISTSAAPRGVHTSANAAVDPCASGPCLNGGACELLDAALEPELEEDDAGDGDTSDGDGASGDGADGADGAVGAAARPRAGFTCVCAEGFSGLFCGTINGQ